MSGGIDSSVTAALLQKASFEIIGVFMHFWHDSGDDWNSCCSSEAEKRARKVAQRLAIPFYAFNFKKEFRKKIIDYFLAEHKKGRTPNPCVVCNKEIKFGFLLEKALELGADYIATGHYARLRREIPKQPYGESPLATAKSQIPKIKLYRGIDSTKDQSYFLWKLNQKQLKHILFPLGNYTKIQVRKMAKKFNLPLLNISESQEICFIATTVNDFLAKQIKTEPGLILTTDGKEIGKHQGLPFYTIGQRKRITAGGVPAHYVLAKDLKNNFLIVTKNKKDLYQKELKLESVNWISGKKLKMPLKVRAKIRYQHIPAEVIVSKAPKFYNLKFIKPQQAITPGQSVVFYKDEELLGGGVIAGT